MDSDVVASNPANARLLRWRHADGQQLKVTVLEPDAIDFWKGGGHPDIAERIVELSQGLPDGSLMEVHGTFCIVHEPSGTILSWITGTAYPLRLSGDAVTSARDAGLSPSKRWSGGQVTDLEHLLGPNWLWGAFKADESQWLRATYDDLSG